MQREINIANISRVVAKSLLLLFLTCYANITLFSHTHVVDGVVILHSHFYIAGHNSNAAESQHGEGELQFINVISHFYAEAQSLFNLAIEIAITSVATYSREVTIPILIVASFALPLLRAPPMPTQE